MSNGLSLEELRLDGRERGTAAGASLRGLDRDEGLARVAALRERLVEKKSALYASGFSSREVQAWAGGYSRGLYDQCDAWLTSLAERTSATAS